jgi:hypothetical protein
MRRVVATLATVAIAVICSAHTPAAFFAGKAGAYDVRISIQPPMTAPGAAAVIVRVGSGATRVAAQVTQWNLGARGASPTVEAMRVAGSRDLWSAHVSLVVSGSYTVRVLVDGAAGHGEAVVQVPSIFTTRPPINAGVRWLLIGLGVVLTLGSVSMAGAAVRETVLAPGDVPDVGRRRRARGALAVASVVAAAVVFGGWRSWRGVDGVYYNGTFPPSRARATVRIDGGQRVLRVSLDDSLPTRRPWAALIPEHGQMMHLFLIREPTMDVAATLHPTVIDSVTYDAALGVLPAGHYRVYAEIAPEVSYSQTLATAIDLVDAPANTEAVPSIGADSDAVCFTGVATSSDTAVLGDGSRLIWRRPVAVGTDTGVALHFMLLGPDGRPAVPEPYMGMPAHAVLSSDSGRTFAHLHSVSALSPAAQQRMLVRMDRADTTSPFRPSSGASRSSAMSGHSMMMPMGSPELVFQLVFPDVKRYRLWIQLKRGGKVLSGAFDISAPIVPPARHAASAGR